MDILSHAAATGSDVGASVPMTEELRQLRAHVARLEAERAALWWAAGHDELTGLPNRRLFCALAAPLLCGDRPAVVLVLDLNGFKPINDQFGHHVGDMVLRRTAARLARCVGDNLVARLGGDEFAAVLTAPRHDPDGPWWQAGASALSAAIADPMPVAGGSVNVTAAIGIAVMHEGLDLPDLLHRADLAMYEAKRTGRAAIAWGSEVVSGSDRSPVPRSVELLVFPIEGGPADSGRGEHRLADSGRAEHRPADRRRGEHRPADRAPVAEAPIIYRRGDPVWVHRAGGWCPGVVEGASREAVTATYRPSPGTGTAVDTVSACYVQTRRDVDLLDTTFAATAA